MRVRPSFHNVEMRTGEGMLSYINTVKELEWILKSMETPVDSQEMALGVLCGLPSPYEHIVNTLDALSRENTVFTLNLVESHLLQKEKGQQKRQWTLAMRKRCTEFDTKEGFLCNKTYQTVGIAEGRETMNSNAATSTLLRNSRNVIPEVQDLVIGLWLQRQLHSRVKLRKKGRFIYL